MTDVVPVGERAEKLPATMVAKPWGRPELPDPFSNPGTDPIGELWFPAPASRPMPVLVKHIFTRERLSIQVHPDDIWARANGLPGGKSECWLVTSAEPGAELGIGLKRPLSPEALRQACLDGSVVDLMVWQPVSPGDFCYIPAGTIHAIGAGLSIVEIQQNNDVTFRLFDYGRPRELHLDAGVAVTVPDQIGLAVQRLDSQDRPDLLAGTNAPFAVDYLVGIPGEVRELPDRSLFVPISGTGGIGAAPWSAGECWMADGGASLTFASAGRAVVARY